MPRVKWGPSFGTCEGCPHLLKFDWLTESICQIGLVDGVGRKLGILEKYIVFCPKAQDLEVVKEYRKEQDERKFKIESNKIINKSW